MQAEAVLSKLQEIINTEKCIAVDGGVIAIIEPGKQASLKQVNIVSIGKNALAIKLDECGFPGQKLFSAQHPMHRACDAVLFCMVDGNPFILCFELKSSEPSRSEICSQFQSAHCLLDFLNSILNTYHGMDIRDWPRRYFLFHDQGKNRREKPPLHEHKENDMPDKALFLPVDNNEKIYLRKLLGKPV